MKEKLTKLYNTLCLIETKGENTKIMGECLRYLEGVIPEAEKLEKKVSDLEMNVQDLKKELSDFHKGE